MTISYDRRADDGLLAALEDWAHSLVMFGTAGQFALDLHMRGYAKNTKRPKTKWATLYVGTTKVLDLEHRPDGKFRLVAHESKVLDKFTCGWRASWEKWQDADRLGGEWDQVDLYLERIIPKVGSRFLKEGSVQAAICGFAHEHMLVFDREAAVTFSSDPEKTRMNTYLGRELLDAVGPPGTARWWNSMQDSLGGECDALALDKNGEVLAIEIKPRTSTGTIRWAPLQVRHYARLFSMWAQSAADDDPDPIDVLTGMVEQRQRLGLIGRGESVPKLKTPIRVRPVIAIGRGYSGAALDGLREVQERLVSGGFNDPPLRVMQATLWGELVDIDA